MTEDQQKELYTAIDWDEKKAIAVSVDAPRYAGTRTINLEPNIIGLNRFIDATYSFIDSPRTSEYAYTPVRCVLHGSARLIPMRITLHWMSNQQATSKQARLRLLWIHLLGDTTEELARINAFARCITDIAQSYPTLRVESQMREHKARKRPCARYINVWMQTYSGIQTRNQAKEIDSRFLVTKRIIRAHLACTWPSRPAKGNVEAALLRQKSNEDRILCS
ncbi:hypothetical protein BO78DRAFT_418841 [Aspergillus sclerotiicarbonarius CBS 121057]|uniref:Uncharacterized protein n=1 Tax=Aspergillus sclerotiicarbonarius (strain CBS 121057 / IBT 28362) TaxID=1448318 RepID=A0A319E8M1_ASPSB|nr:hypothetical protein BO78DRAFT_418841 [Aspergillus sclerotiicarbonarius CBS 121057]